MPMDGACVNLKANHQLDGEQINTLVQVVIENVGKQASRPAFNEAMLGLFEDMAGFEALPTRDASRLLGRLWSQYRVVCKASE